MAVTIPFLFLVGLLVFCVHADTGFTDKPSILSTLRPRQGLSPEEYHVPFSGKDTSSLQLSPAIGDLELVDTVILASVDGKLHGLNRTTGRMLWSITDDPSSLHPSPSTFDSLVRTQHSSYDSDREVFIIEPQSGDIYVLPPMASPSDPLQRLPLSMQQLVEMSPFSFSGDEKRTFVGRKETSMMIIELNTGKVKGTVNADKECFWHDEQVLEEDLDQELDETKPPKHKLHSPEIHIGRTDYHVRVHSQGQGVVQNLFYSSYGPNNIDRDKQSHWKRTPDGLYVQPLPNGQVLAFQTEGAQAARYDDMPVWGQVFSQPIVATFDIVTSPSRSNPLALLQPRPHFEHLFPRRSSSMRRPTQPLPEVTYVGLVGSSLYAMSHENFPLVVFDQDSSRMPSSGSKLPVMPVCDGIQCLVGSRKFEPSQLHPLLIDAVPTIPGLLENPVSPNHAMSAGSVNSDSDGNESRTSHHGTARQARKYDDIFIRKWSLIGCIMVLFTVLTKLLVKFWNAPTSIPSDIPVNPMNSIEDPKPVPESFQISTPSPSSPESAAVERTISPEPDLVPSTPKPGTTPDLSTISWELVGGPEDGDESEKDGPLDILRRKGPRRRKRGKKKKAEAVESGTTHDEDVVATKDVHVPDEIHIVPTIPSTSMLTPSASSLLVSDTVLGFGSHGTVVYEGSLQGRAVAVKRLLQDFVTIAAREVELLQESDDHPNVIRYFYKESKDGFLYIALELCPASLADIVERPDAFSSIASVFDPTRALAQVTAGLRHLHMLKIVHRDIKPQNILVSQPKNGQHRMLISDFGLCKKLDVDQSSFLPTGHGAMAAGTVGWRAPEILRGEVKLDEQPMDPDDLSSRGSNTSARSSSSTSIGHPTRLTKSVDVFALGCLYYYTLTSGSHPYGDRFEREVNILKGRMDLRGLEQYGEEGSEAAHLISTMLDQDSKARPDTTSCLIHPFFWTPARRLNFLQDASDRFEIMCRDPREAPLITLEASSFDVVGNDWHSRLDKVFVENLGKFRKYDGRSVQDLLRALRNKKHHYQDLPDHVKRHLGPLPEGFLGYFTRRFPDLFLHVHGVIQRCGLARESIFQSYFELADP